MYLDTCCGKWIVSPEVTDYTECKAFCPVVRIGSPHLLTRKQVLLPPFGSKGGDTLACGGGARGGVGDPIPMKGQTLWYLFISTYKTSTTEVKCQGINLHGYINFLAVLTLSYLLAVSPNLAFFRPGFLKKILR
jgi:hypothetical protein